MWGDFMNASLGVDIAITASYEEGAGEVLVQNGDMQTINDKENVRQALIMRLYCPKGTLIRHPEYGNGIYDKLSEPMSDEFLALATADIQECISQEPRTELVSVTPLSMPRERIVQFVIKYRIKGRPDVDNLVYTEVVND